jgi:hypothetical protein
MDRFHRKIVLLSQLAHRFDHCRHLDIGGATATLADQVMMGEVVAEGVIAEMNHSGTVTEVNVVEKALLLKSVDAAVNGGGDDVAADPLVYPLQ